MATAVSTYLNRKTPGVYVTEIPAFGTSIVGVETAVPAFVGYTACAGDPKTGQPLYNQPVRLSSMTEYVSYFGGPAPLGFAITLAPTPAPAPAPATGTGGKTDAAANADATGTSPSANGAPTAAPTPPPPSFVAQYSSAPAQGATDPTVAPTGFMLASTALPDQPNQFNLYWQMRLFFANGGGDCFVISCGSYWLNQAPVSQPDPVPDDWFMGAIAAGAADGSQAGLMTGVAAAGYAVGATMTVVPEACQLVGYDEAAETITADGYAAVARQMLDQASLLQDRVAILDLPGCMAQTSLADVQAGQNAFWTAIAPSIAGASYGAAYAPAVNSAIVTPADVMYTSLLDAGGDNSVMNNILTTQANALYKDAQLATLQAAIAAAFPAKGRTANAKDYSGDGGAYPAVTGTLAQWQLALDNLLTNTLPVFAQIQQQIATAMSVAPPSAMMAGVWSKNDAQRGVWNAPANIALASVNSPLYVMNDAEQAGFNLPTNGQAIDVIRAQPSRGNVVWGARTLDGNSQDFRYIQVRRTLIYVEQSIKLALQGYVFAANDATTWSSVVASIGGFLTGLWQQGGLMGSKPDEAFGVACGLGSTMTPQNVLDGYMVVAITLQMIHPAEFIELTFTQKMGS